MTKPPTAEQVVRAMFHQLRSGCNSFECTNKSCRSCPDFSKKELSDPNEIALLAIDLSKSYKDHICGGVPPTFFDGEIESVSKSFSALVRGSQKSIDREKAAELLKKVFSNTVYFSHLFLKNGQIVTAENIGIDEETAELCSDMFYTDMDFFGSDELRSAFNTMFSEFVGAKLETYDQFRFLLVLPAFRFYFDELNAVCSDKYLPLLNYILDLPEIPRDLFYSQLKVHIDVTWGYIRLIQHNMSLYIIITANKECPIKDETVLKSGTLLTKMRNDNSQTVDPIRTREFYNDPFSEQYLANVSKTRVIELPDFTRLSAIINLETKFDILSKTLTISQNRLFNKSGLVIKVRRDHLLEDAIEQFRNIQNSDSLLLTTKLQIKFDGEDGVDAGGVSREFFYLVTAELFNPDFGMFTMLNGRYWFYPATLENGFNYKFLGKIIGLAVLNRIILPIRFPIAFYRKLKGTPVRLVDLKEVEPDMFNSLTYMLEMKKNGENVSDVGITFTGTYSKFGEIIVDNLIENGDSTIVDNNNVDEYIESYIDWYFNKLTDASFNSFKLGFNAVFEKKYLDIFTADELQIIVSGEETYDWIALRYGTRYADGYDSDSRAVKWFWNIFFNKLTEEQRIDFLLFSTGADKAPVGGLVKTKLTIQRIADPTKLPVSHTCFNIFALPDYPDEDLMERNIKIALAHKEGFGLK